MRHEWETKQGREGEAAITNVTHQGIKDIHWGGKGL